MNPARRLHQTIVEWSEAHGNSSAVNSYRDLETATGMQEQLDAIGDLRLVEQGLDVLEELGLRVSVYRRYVDDWRNMVLAFPAGWNVTALRREVYPMAPLDQLDTLADRFDERLPDVTPDQRAKLEAITGQAQSVLDEDQTLSPMLRLYLGRLLREIRAALDDESLSERFDYVEASRRLWVTLNAAAEQSTDDGARTKWRDTAKRFVWDASIALIGNGPSVGLALTGLS